MGWMSKREIKRYNSTHQAPERQQSCGRTRRSWDSGRRRDQVAWFLDNAGTWVEAATHTTQHIDVGKHTTQCGFGIYPYMLKKSSKSSATIFAKLNTEVSHTHTQHTQTKAWSKGSEVVIEKTVGNILMLLTFCRLHPLQWNLSARDTPWDPPKVSFGDRCPLQPGMVPRRRKGVVQGREYSAVWCCLLINTL
jgi:hypothetical protein